MSTTITHVHNNHSLMMKQKNKTKNQAKLKFKTRTSRSNTTGTMDYGPFGFMEKYDPYWNMWVGGGRSYSFSKQPDAAYVDLWSAKCILYFSHSNHICIEAPNCVALTLH